MPPGYSLFPVLLQGYHLIVVAHSMGGNIVYDILTHYRTDLKIDLLVTVGSQVALFKEMHMFKEDDARGAVSNGAIPKPANVGHWINIYDPLDVLGFATKDIFQGTSDYEFHECANLLTAHTAYFDRPFFHERLRARIGELTFESKEAVMEEGQSGVAN